MSERHQGLPVFSGSGLKEVVVSRKIVICAALQCDFAVSMRGNTPQWTANIEARRDEPVESTSKAARLRT